MGELLPFVSIIIPVKNEEKFIALCLESLASLDFPPDRMETIVVDNMSTDRTKEICESYDVKVVFSKAKTVAGVRNYGSSLSRGDIFIFLDGDCTVEPGWLHEGIKYLHGTNVSAVGFAPSSNDYKSWIARCRYILNNPTKFSGCDEVQWLATCNLFVWKQSYNLVGGFNEDLITCEDVDFGYRLSSFSRLLHCNTASVLHLGEDKTIKDLFFKEIWRANGCLSAIILNKKYSVRNIGGILLPVLFVMAHVGLLFSLICGNGVLVFLLYIIFNPILVLRLKRIKQVEMGYLLKLWVFVYVYLMARGIATVLYFT